jgi:AraC family transcriptional regulator of arabinose operon
MPRISSGGYDPATVRSGPRVPSYIWTGHENRTSRVIRPTGIKPNWHLILSVSGEGSFRQPGFELPLRAGDLILFPPDCYQDYGAVDGASWENYFAHFAPRPTWHAWMRWPEAGSGVRHVSLPEGPIRTGVLDAMLRCDRYAHSAFSSYAHELALSALEEAILLGAHQARFGRSGREPSPGIARVVQVIESDLTKAFTVRLLAREAGYSPSRFAHLFKQEIGEPVIAYINRLRISTAARLLEAEGMSVKEAAHAVGFRSPFYFSRMFRRFYLIDPSSFRRHAAGLRLER